MRGRPIAAVLVGLLLLLWLPGCGALPSDSALPPDSSRAAAPETPISTDPQRASLHTQIREHGFAAGMAFLGYVDGDAAENTLRSYVKSSPYAENYAFLCDAPLVDAGGTELYAVVAAQKECRTSVYRAALTDSGEYDVRTENTLYAGRGADCFLLRCNVSDIHANAAVLFKSGDTSFSVFPMLSGADGRLTAEGCYDFSIYADKANTEDKNVSIARELLTTAKEVQERMAQGMTVLYTGEHQIIQDRNCLIFALGTNRNDQFVREYLYAVCDNCIYTYDALSDTWSALGAE